MKYFLLFALLPLCSTSQVITTYAGGGGSFCEGCIATSTRIQDPSGSVFDANGNCIFASGLGGNRVRKIDAVGNVNSIAGTGTSGFSGDGGMAISAQLNTPECVRIDNAGNIYIADVNNYRIRKVSASSGIISTIAGIGITGYNGDGIPATSARFRPVDILLDNTGNIFIADYDGRRVRKIDVAGIIHTIAGTGTVGTNGDGGPATAAEINPTSLAIDKVGNLYIADPYANVVRKINTAGIISTIAGNGNWIYAGDGIPATNAQLQPNHITIDHSENLYISDNFNKRVFRVNKAGIIHCVAGNGVGAYAGDGGPATAASFDNNVEQLSVDSCNNVYLSETSGRIRKIAFNPECWPAGVNDVSKNNMNVRIYPNPANRELAITGAGINSIVITDAIGKKLISQEYKSTNKAEINISHLPPGMYLVRVNGVWVQRFMKE